MSRAYVMMVALSSVVALLSYFIQVVVFAPTAEAGQLWSSSFSPSKNASSDYVVIGGGTAGHAVAARLPENAFVSVAVIEVGGSLQVDNGSGSVVPGALLQPIHWHYAEREHAAEDRLELCHDSAEGEIITNERILRTDESQGEPHIDVYSIQEVKLRVVDRQGASCPIIGVRKEHSSSAQT